MYIVPKPIEIKVLENYKIWLKFEDGEEKTFDMEKYIHKKFYHKLKDRKYFENVKVVENTIQWKDGEDVAPENLYYDSVKFEQKPL
ncbi:MAG: DUF2442 domain-containing protein [Clostridia bacterium]|nr:DUF2442 domain-containing protein [Clostridia bacterium]